MWQAKIIAHSVSRVTGKEIVTWELVYPRFIHSELMTHRMLSKNAASSRAIPVQKVIDLVRESPALPIHWGKNEPGMQANEELPLIERRNSQIIWRNSARSAVEYAEVMRQEGAHKQIVNRILEPFQWMKTVVTGTEWDNFYWLRHHEDAQPEFKYLTGMMLDALSVSSPVVLSPGEWHVPYFGEGYWNDRNTDYSLQNALNISMSCCGQVSYRTLDDTLEKAEKVVSRLNLEGANNAPVHASPSEHQATPMQAGGEFWDESGDYKLNTEFPETWEEGITAYHKELGFMSGNLSGWIQNRQLIKGNTRWG